MSWRLQTALKAADAWSQDPGGDGAELRKAIVAFDQVDGGGKLLRDRWPVAAAISYLLFLAARDPEGLGREHRLARRTRIAEAVQALLPHSGLPTDELPVARPVPPRAAGDAVDWRLLQAGGAND